MIFKCFTRFTFKSPGLTHGDRGQQRVCLETQSNHDKRACVSVWFVIRCSRATMLMSPVSRVQSAHGANLMWTASTVYRQLTPSLSHNWCTSSYSEWRETYSVTQ